MLQRYITRVPITRPYFDAKPDSPLAAFIAEAPRHPVFQLGQRLNRLGVKSYIPTFKWLDM